ncbi:MAG: YndJ family transporter [Candidatus Koribacter versatilis]|uniref:YndJ family transporter n=1 Tax=Candidatus Korobacter versatilis TaxID=658062 RepID=A0A932A919_9BACT|nr:YndJ family transporter [Candidatus Koribacter versatilis]
MSSETAIRGLAGFGILVLVPLALRLEEAAGDRLSEWATRLVLPAGLLAVAAELADRPVAAVLALPWCAVAAVRAVAGAGRAFAWRERQLHLLCTAAAGLYWLVAAGWLVLSAARIAVPGVPPIIVLLTSVHFHFTGYLSLVLTVEAGRRLGDDPGWTRRLYQTAAATIVFAMPMVAAGFVLWPPLQVLGAVPLVLAEIAIAFILAFEAVEPRSALARWLLWISAFSSVAPMVLGAMFVTRVLFGAPPISLAQMVLMHGVVNAFGFLGCALLGCNLAARDGSVLHSH